MTKVSFPLIAIVALAFTLLAYQNCGPGLRGLEVDGGSRADTPPESTPGPDLPETPIVCQANFADPFPEPAFGFVAAVGAAISSRTLDVSDLTPAAQVISLKNLDGTPMTGGKVKLLNVTTSVYYPVGGFADGGAACFRARADPELWAAADANGVVQIQAPPGFYIITVAKDVVNERGAYFQASRMITGASNFQLQPALEAKLEYLMDGAPLAGMILQATSASRKPGFHPARLGFTGTGKFVLETTRETKATVKAYKPASAQGSGHIWFVDLDMACPSLDFKVSKTAATLSQLDFRALNEAGVPESIGRVDFNFHDFYMNNFAELNSIPGQATFFTNARRVGFLQVIDKGGYYFALLRPEGYVQELTLGAKKMFTFGGPLTLQLKTYTFNPPRFATKNYFWFLVKDGSGNLLDFYNKPAGSPPNVLVTRNGAVVFNQVIAGGPGRYNTETRNQTLLEPVAEHLVTFSESLGPWGSINISGVPMSQLTVPLISFQSINLDFILPQELAALQTDFTANFDRLYDAIATRFGVRTTEKIPVRTVVTDGANVAWAPLGGPTKTLTCQSTSYQCLFYWAHELGHPYTINAPISSDNPNFAYNEESKASYVGTQAVLGVFPFMGENYRGDVPSTYRKFIDAGTCNDTIETIQNLHNYLDKRYPAKKATVEAMVSWNAKYAANYTQLTAAGFNRDEAYGAIYSRITGDNLGSLWQSFGLATAARVTAAIQALGL